MRKIFNHFLFSIGAMLLLNSCAEELNFNQIDDLNIVPEVEASLLYVESSERLINATIGNEVYTQKFGFGAFNEKFFAEKVISGSITYIVENTTSKNLDILVEFLDDADAVLDTEQFVLQPEPTAVLQREIAYGPSGRNIDIIRNTVTLKISAINLGDNTSESSVENPKVIVKSSGKFKLKVK